MQGGNEIEGEGEYFREILAFLVFSGLLEMSQKVSMCLKLILLHSAYGVARKPKQSGCNYPSCSSKL